VLSPPPEAETFILATPVFSPTVKVNSLSFSPVEDIAIFFVFSSKLTS
jgi:hypothetical protein